MQIEQLMKTLSLGELHGEPKEVTGGLLHKMYHVETSVGEYAVKVLNGEIMKRPSALQNTINSEIIAAAFSSGIPVVAALKIQGQQVHELDGSFYMVFPWVEGKSLFPPDIAPNHCAVIGDLLGRMHARKLYLEGIEPEPAGMTIFDWDGYLQMAGQQEDRSEAWISLYESSLANIKQWNQAAYDAQISLAKNRVISHRDLDPKNVMWKDDKPFVIDWEAAGYVNPYQEFLEVLCYWADDGHDGLLDKNLEALLSAYRKHISPEGADWDVVFAGSYAGTLEWLEYNIKRALGIEASDKEEIRLGKEQVEGTVRALHAYGGKIELLKDVLNRFFVST